MAQPRITRDEVQRIAALARLELSEPEAEAMTRDLDQLLDYVALLGELDTAGVVPTSHAIPLPTPLREDRPVEPMDPTLAVAGAPEREGTAFVVPVVIAADEEG